MLVFAIVLVPVLARVLAKTVTMIEIEVPAHLPLVIGNALG